ncbi:hypothetical protein [Flavobacterium johnsoniae]|uniref:hypothetical protein n=1 Tax=Flavobacterium johnsoniae TaxID=986 RepID=UPI000EB0BF26|nr:hypothetical protein [Flavobacterium johnsoniae]
MSGMYHPIAQGEIDGHKEGLNCGLSLIEFVGNFEFKTTNKEYFIGFGAGFKKGQILRAHLEKLEITLPFEERIACCQYMFWEKNRCDINRDDYLDHIQNWDNFSLDLNICNKVLDFLEENKIQKCFDEILTFYKQNFRLQAFKEFDLIYNYLKKMRQKKIITKDYDTREDRAKIDLKLKNWIKNNQE